VTAAITGKPVVELLDLTGRMAIVTGGAMGIGKAIAERFSEAGAAVVVADLDADAATRTAESLSAAGREVLAVKVDVSSDDEVATLFEAALAWRPELHILVNNAGIFPAVPVTDMTVFEYDRVQDVNLRGSFLCAREAARIMRHQRRGGSIVNITSIDALHPSGVGLAHYDASKHGLWGFTKNLALELAPYGIRVNAVAPGAIDTPGVAAMSAISAIDQAEFLKAFVERVPLRRIGVGDDIARIALVLASDVSSYMTGSQVVVDGGYLLT
jgi:2-deoxy-D-gluconate 3-dehydrogenase